MLAPAPLLPAFVGGSDVASGTMSFADFLAAIKEPALRDIALHWSVARGEKRMPAWKDIDPAAIARHLPILWSWKYDRGSDSFTGRLAGEDINAIFGKNLRGAKMSDFFADWQYDLIFARSKRVVSEPAFARGTGPVFIHAGRRGTGERIILPLATDGLHADGLLGATVYRLEPSRHDQETAEWDLAAEQVDFFPVD